MFAGVCQRCNANTSAASRSVELRLQALELTHKTFLATRSARHIGSGGTSKLRQHDRHAESGDANQYMVLHVTHTAANNLPAQVVLLLQSVGFQA